MKEEKAGFLLLSQTPPFTPHPITFVIVIPLQCWVILDLIHFSDNCVGNTFIAHSYNTKNQQV